MCMALRRFSYMYFVTHQDEILLYPASPASPGNFYCQTPGLQGYHDTNDIMHTGLVLYLAVMRAVLVRTCEGSAHGDVSERTTQGLGVCRV